jgi:methionyl-tRNA formyltransferase
MAIRTLFLGSNHEALETLKALNENVDFKIVGVITQPDKAVGRKHEIIETEISKYCKGNNISVFHTQRDEEKYREALDLFKPELNVCKSFGEIIPGFFLEFPKYKSINIHFSLLPKYRGAVPIQMAILNGDEKTGLSIIKMTKELDNGDILAQFEEEIKSDDTNITLRERLVRKTAEILPEVLIKWVNGDIVLKKQDESLATYCWKEDIGKEKAKIDFEKHTAREIERMVRALVPWPVAWTVINGKKTKIFEVKINEEKIVKSKEFLVENHSLFIGTKEKAIEILKLQMEGKKEMEIKEFLNGINVASIQ